MKGVESFQHSLYTFSISTAYNLLTQPVNLQFYGLFAGGCARCALVWVEMRVLVVARGPFLFGMWRGGEELRVLRIAGEEARCVLLGGRTGELQLASADH